MGGAGHGGRGPRMARPNDAKLSGGTDLANIPGDGRGGTPIERRPPIKPHRRRTDFRRVYLASGIKNSTEVPSLAPKKSFTPSSKFEPKTATSVPPVSGPLVGVTDVTAGA